MFMIRFLVYINNKTTDGKFIFSGTDRLTEPCPSLFINDKIRERRQKLVSSLIILI